MIEPPALSASNAEWAKWEAENPVHVFRFGPRCVKCGASLSENMDLDCKPVGGA